MIGLMFETTKILFEIVRAGFFIFMKLYTAHLGHGILTKVFLGIGCFINGINADC